MRRVSKSSKLSCAFCQGEGVQPGAGRLSCIVCNGRGRITIKQPYNICKECGGRGKKKGVNLYCLLCRGKGFVEESRHSLMGEPSSLKIKREKGKRRKDRFREREPIEKLRSKTRGLKRAVSKIIKVKTAVKEERKFFFKKLFGAIKIL